jgi:oxygen-independent coproporphyrinogen-3 oxidase
VTAAYVHVPFCGRVCPYCDFAVVAGRDGLMDRYVDALISEIGMEQSIPALDAVFLGGGTPSRLPSESLARILQALADRFGFADNVEVSLEANPEDWTGELAAGLVRAGFNRVSFGAQSFDPGVLRYLGRQHSPADIDNGVAVSRRAGFASVSLDLIFGAPPETPASWSATVDAALKLEPDHVSTYALTVERGTALSRLVSAGAAAPDPDDQADKYELAQRRLVAAGLDHYEVSNYARAGHECRYNLNTWAQGDYVAFGLGAHGHVGGVRRRNVRNLDTYLDRVAGGEPPELGREVIHGWDKELERAFLGVRMRQGVEVGRVAAAFSSDPEGKQLVDGGVVAIRGDRLQVVDPLLTDAVARVVLGLAEPAQALSTRT